MRRGWGRIALRRVVAKQIYVESRNLFCNSS
jgi:hypothetical protein